MGDALEYGRRPFLVEQPAKESGLGLQCCPGASLEHTFDPSDPELEQELVSGWGPVYDVWEGFATDDAIRLAGSSGGAATALALYCIEQGGMSGVLHTGARQDAVHLNESVYSTSRKELLDRTGSRYAPASPCDGLHFIEQAAGPSVFRRGGGEASRRGEAGASWESRGNPRLFLCGNSFDAGYFGAIETGGSGGSAEY